MPERARTRTLRCAIYTENPPKRAWSRISILQAQREVTPATTGSVVKRRNGLDRCRYKGDSGMRRAGVSLGVISDNLINIAPMMSRRATQ